MLLSTFGAKIAPYGFEYAGIEARRRYHFERMVGGKEQSFVIQRNNGSFQLEIHTGSENPEIRELFWDLWWHQYRDDEELENILNTLGAHVVARVIPILPELSAPGQEYDCSATGEMYIRLGREKETLLRHFLERHRINGIEERDLVMEKLLRELERIKTMPLPEMMEMQTELAAVWGYLLIRDVGGQWGGGLTNFLVCDCPLVSSPEDPLMMVNRCCREGGGAAFVKRYLTILGGHRRRVREERRVYGSNWEPPKTSRQENTGLLNEDIVKAVLAKNLSEIGFCYEQQIGQWWELKKISEDEMRIKIKEELCCRKTFFITLWRNKENRREYLYKKFCFYQDESELRHQLEAVSGEIKEAVLAGHPIEDPYYHHSYACHVTAEMNRIFRAEEKEMAERFWTRNGLERTSEEDHILRCIAKEIDSMAGADYEESKRQLMELSAAYGALLIRDIGGHWSVDEEFRMKRRPMFLQDVPAIGTIDLPTDLIRHWEYGGGESFLWAHQEYKWKYETWKRLCQLADIAL